MLRIAAVLIALMTLASCTSTPALSPQARTELAPTGKIRVGINYGNPLFTKRDAASGELSGIAVDLARELGRRAGIPVELVGYESGGSLTAGLKSGGWDIAVLAYEQAREVDITYAG